jgi:hypothetical protein
MVEAEKLKPPAGKKNIFETVGTPLLLDMMNMRR